MHNGYIYSVEGDTGGVDRTPAIRIFDARRGEAVFETELVQYGLNIEPEFIDFENTMTIIFDGRKRTSTICESIGFDKPGVYIILKGRE